MLAARRIAMKWLDRARLDALGLKGGTTMTDVGTFRIDIELEHHVHRGRKLTVPNALVDTGADATWIPARLLEQIGVTVERTETYQMADGRVLTRSLGYVI